MIVRLQRSTLPGEPWLLFARDTAEAVMVALPREWAGMVRGDKAWFRAVENEEGWRLLRLVAAPVP